MPNASEQALFEIVQQAVVHVLNRKVELNENTSLSQEGLDSITTVRLLVELEKKLNIQFQEEHLSLDNFASIRSIINTLDHYGVTA
ncbi:acyl carrier protein [Paenibacillus methanolicus]|uniref:D-alanine--poly(Phosphoribitol) ligase subunit 2 n=1 Tax=Paenibacillus methanolicus TaxID=582686 RepID=A0A5S5C3S3_9BACL|nr:phosphopantetheine-binding protein [Paenibacillus methanolicus]TYP73076.1 D-alanine--poly(phosphoribitol) ligase subunit 2 [Paenibacillus methanolicus]